MLTDYITGPCLYYIIWDSGFTLLPEPFRATVSRFPYSVNSAHPATGSFLKHLFVGTGRKAIRNQHYVQLRNIVMRVPMRTDQVLMFLFRCQKRAVGIEPASPAWKAGAQPLYHARVFSLVHTVYTSSHTCQALHQKIFLNFFGRSFQLTFLQGSSLSPMRNAFSAR